MALHGGGEARQRRCFDYFCHSCSQTPRCQCQTHCCPGQTSWLSLANLRRLSSEFAAVRNNSAKTDNSLFEPVSTQEWTTSLQHPAAAKCPSQAPPSPTALVQRRPPCSAAFLFRRTLLQSRRCLADRLRALSTPTSQPQRNPPLNSRRSRGDVIIRAATRCTGGLHPGASGAEPGTLSWAGGGKGC